MVHKIGVREPAQRCDDLNPLDDSGIGEEHLDSDTPDHNDTPQFDDLSDLIQRTLQVPAVFVTRAKAPKKTHAICQHIIASSAPLRIDSSEEFPFANYPFSDDDLHIQGYELKSFLGTPIYGTGDDVIGSLSIIDEKPRNWTKGDLQLLQVFARNITLELQAHQTAKQLSENKEKLDASHKSISQLSRIASQSDTAVAEYGRDLTLICANQAYAALHNLTVDDITGKHASEILGPRTFPLVEATLKKALDGEPYSYTVDRVTEEGKSKCLYIRYRPFADEHGEANSILAVIDDISEQQSHTIRADKLDERLTIANQMSTEGFIIFNACRLTHDTEITDLEIEYMNPAAASYFDERVDNLIEKKLTEVVPYDRGDDLIEALVNVIDTGETYNGELHASLRGQDIWLEISAVKLTDGCATSFRDVTERKNAESHREFLMNELNHRVKNSLATIQAIARQTIGSAKDGAEFEANFSARLTAIAAAHDILMESEHGRASLVTMIERQVAPYTDDRSMQLITHGDDVMLSGPCAHAVGLVLHELTTNAAKYGALSKRSGHVEIKWSEDTENRIKLFWNEVGGPPVSEPSHEGFGSQLIQQSLEYSLDGSASLNYASDGLRVELIIPVELHYDA